MEKLSLFDRLKQKYFSKKYAKRRFATSWQLHNLGDRLEFRINHAHRPKYNGLVCGIVYQNDPNTLHFYPHWSVLGLHKDYGIQNDWLFVQYVFSASFYIARLRLRRTTAIKIRGKALSAVVGVGWMQIQYDAKTAGWQIKAPPPVTKVVDKTRKKETNARIRSFCEAFLSRAHLGAFGEASGTRLAPLTGMHREIHTCINAQTVEDFHYWATTIQLHSYWRQTYNRYKNGPREVAKQFSWRGMLSAWLKTNRHKIHDFYNTFTPLTPAEATIDTAVRPDNSERTDNAQSLELLPPDDL